MKNIINFLLLIIIIYLLLCIYNMYVKKYSYSIENIEEKIISLKKIYKHMLDSRRVIVELCNKSDKLGNTRSNVYSVGNNCEPWISRECIFVLDHILSHKTIGLEWSSGSSTIWLGYRIKSLISIENSYEWANTVRNITNRLNLNKIVSVYYIGEDKFDLCKNESKYISYNNLCYKTYVINNKIENKLYDYISVDGRARTGCILRAINLLKPNKGILLVDNSERSRYKWAINKISQNWNRFDFPYSNGVVTMWISHSY